MTSPSPSPSHSTCCKRAGVLPELLAHIPAHTHPFSPQAAPLPAESYRQDLELFACPGVTWLVDLSENSNGHGQARAEINHPRVVKRSVHKASVLS